MAAVVAVGEEPFLAPLNDESAAAPLNRKQVVMPTSCFLLLFIFFVFLHFRLTLPLEERAWGQLREGCWRGGVWPRVLYERRRLLSANNLQSRDDDEEPRRLEGEGAGSRRKRVRGWTARLRVGGGVSEEQGQRNLVFFFVETSREPQ